MNRYSIDTIDAPIARKTVESISRPFHIYSVLVIAMIGSCLFIAGIVSGGLSGLDHTTLPDTTLMLLLGIVGCAFFFPIFVCLYCCRVLLRAIRDLEQKVESLSHDA